MKADYIKAQRKVAQDSLVKKEHFKLYKSGRLWLVAGLATLSFGIAGLTVTQDAQAIAKTAADQTISNTTTGTSTAVNATAANATASTKADDPFADFSTSDWLEMSSHGSSKIYASSGKGTDVAGATKFTVYGDSVIAIVGADNATADHWTAALADGTVLASGDASSVVADLNGAGPAVEITNDKVQEMITKSATATITITIYDSANKSLNTFHFAFGNKEVVSKSDVTVNYFDVTLDTTATNGNYADDDAGIVAVGEPVVYEPNGDGTDGENTFYLNADDIPAGYYVAGTSSGLQNIAGVVMGQFQDGTEANESVYLLKYGTLAVNYVDTDANKNDATQATVAKNNETDIATTVKVGENGTYDKDLLTIPTGYELADPDQPLTYTVGADGKAEVTVNLVHKTTKIDDSHTITSKVDYVYSGGTKDGQTAHDSATTTSTVTRTATTDEATNEVTYSDWDEAAGKAITDVESPEIAGYKADKDTAGALSLTDIEANAGDGNAENDTVTTTVKYTANDMTYTLTPVDSNGKAIPGTTATTKTGKAGETITDFPTIPGYTIVPNQNLMVPDTDKGNVNVQYAQSTFTPNNPGTDTGVNDMDALTKTVTETAYYGAPVGGSDVIATDTFYRTATLNEDGSYTYSIWTTNKDGVSTTENDQRVQYVGVDSKVPAGYTASVVTDVNGKLQNNNYGVGVYGGATTDVANAYVTRTFTYTAKDQKTNIQYIDDVTGKQVGDLTALTGVTDGTADWTAAVPANYELAKGQDAGGTYKFAAKNNANVVIHLTHKHTIKANAAQTTNTVTYKGINGENPATVVKSINWTSDTDAVTDDVVWTSDVATTTVNTPEITGYTADKAAVSFTNATATNEKPTNQNATVIYTGKVGTVYVNYVDADGKATTATDATVNGLDTSFASVVGATGTYEPNIDSLVGYALSADQDFTYTVNTDGTVTVTVKVVHTHTTDTATTHDTVIYTGAGDKTPPTNDIEIKWTADTDDATGIKTWTPTAATTTIDSPEVTGYTAHPLTVEFINAPGADGAPADQTLKVNYSANEVDYTVTPVDENGDPIPGTKPSNETGTTGDDAKIPEVPGYTVKPGQDVNVPNTDANVDVIYTPNDQLTHIQYVDDDNGGKQVGDLTELQGVTNGTTDWTASAPKGYDLAEGQSTSGSYTFADKANTNVVIHLVHKHTIKENAATTHNTVTYSGAGDKTPEVSSTAVVWKSDLDEATGIITWTPSIAET